MPMPSPSILLSTFLFASFVLGLQVTPNSACSSVCIDNINNDPSDPSTSNTYGNDISCNDADYSSATGAKFEKCLNCLQNSTDAGSGESDQHWFLYNLRYSVDWCLFGFPNNSQTASNPCMTEFSCGPLANALESDNLNTTNATTYDYCTTDGGAFLSSSLSACVTCLQNLQNQAYLANFIVALEAGCEQRPSGDTLVGLQGSIFSKTAVNITRAITASATAAAGSHHSSSLSLGGKIGIVVGCLIFALFLIGFLFVYFKKRNYKHNIQSSFDTRYGAKDISSPNSGAYINSAYMPSQQYTPPPPPPPPMPRSQSMSKPPLKPPYTAGDFYDQQQQQQQYATYPRAVVRDRSPSPPYQPEAYNAPEYVPDRIAALPVHAAYLPNPQEKYAMDAYPNPSTSPPPTHNRSSGPASPDAHPHTQTSPSASASATSPNSLSQRTQSTHYTHSPSYLSKQSPAISTSPGAPAPAESKDGGGVGNALRKGTKEVAIKVGFLPPPTPEHQNRAWSPESPVEQWPGEY